MIEEINKICKTEINADLASYNTYRLHSKVHCMCFIENTNQLIELLNVLKKYNVKWFVLGNGSNIVLPNYYDGVIIKLSGFNKSYIKNDILYCEASCMINKIATKTSLNGYAGLEFACGIPGTIGGSIYGNAGAFGGCVADTLISATVYNGKDVIELLNEDFKFAKRYSILRDKKNSKYIILSAKFKLSVSDAKELKDKIVENNKKRISSQDLDHPSCGSVFKNPQGLSAGKLIDDLGLKGLKVNGAMVSHKHANFIINTGNATGDDIVKLIKIIKKKVKDVYKIDLKLEQQIIK